MQLGDLGIAKLAKSEGVAAKTQIGAATRLQQIINDIAQQQVGPARHNCMVQGHRITCHQRYGIIARTAHRQMCGLWAACYTS
jgi:hypothetical protein